MTVGLVMIVRDEAARIERCLESVRPHIQHFTICDTGSVDDTEERALRVLKGVPGEYHHRTWVNFGHNLTEATELAQNTATWLLRMDADMTVGHVHPGTWDWLAEDAFPDVAQWMVEIVHGNLTYRLPLLMRGGMDWWYEGATHEYLAPDRPRGSLLGFWVGHHADGTHRADKELRDIELLKPGVAAGDARSIFYTAQCLRDMGRAGDAATMYERRAAMNGWEEEAWYAAYQAAKLRQDVGELLEAHKRRPWRPEPLRAAAEIVSRDTRGDVLFLERT